MKKEIKKLPRYKIDDIVYACSADDAELVLMCKVLGAECKCSEPSDWEWYYSLSTYKLAKKVDTFICAESDLLIEKEDVDMPF